MTQIVPQKDDFSSSYIPNPEEQFFGCMKCIDSFKMDSKCKLYPSTSITQLKKTDDPNGMA